MLVIVESCPGKVNIGFEASAMSQTLIVASWLPVKIWEPSADHSPVVTKP